MTGCPVQATEMVFSGRIDQNLRTVIRWSASPLTGARRSARRIVDSSRSPDRPGAHDRRSRRYQAKCRRSPRPTIHGGTRPPSRALRRSRASPAATRCVYQSSSAPPASHVYSFHVQARPPQREQRAIQASTWAAETHFRSRCSQASVPAPAAGRPSRKASTRAQSNGTSTISARHARYRARASRGSRSNHGPTGSSSSVSARQPQRPVVQHPVGPVDGHLPRPDVRIADRRHERIEALARFTSWVLVHHALPWQHARPTPEDTTPPPRRSPWPTTNVSWSPPSSSTCRIA